MTKSQRIRKINRENTSLTIVTVRKYVDSHYLKNPYKAEQLSPLIYVSDKELYKIIRLMKKTSKLLLTKDYFWAYCDFVPSHNQALYEVILNYNERKYEEKIIEHILKCSDEKKEMRLINKLNEQSINILRDKRGYIKPSYSNSYRRSK